MDEQSGYRANRGTIDGLFRTRKGLHKRKEQNLDSWISFVDLVKAFDSLPREALFAVPQRCRLLNHFGNIIIRLSKHAKFKVKIGSEDSELEGSIGLRKG
jgi:hypothetical protein